MLRFMRSVRIIRHSLGPSGVVIAHGKGILGLVSFKLTSASDCTMLGRPTKASKCISPRRRGNKPASIHGSVCDINIVLSGVELGFSCHLKLEHYLHPLTRQCPGVATVHRRVRSLRHGLLTF